VSLEALIFDVDGTLADTERDGHRLAFNRAFAEAGLDWEWTEAVYGELLAVTGGKERIRYYVANYRPEFEVPADFDDQVAALHAAKTRFYTEMMERAEIPFRPGVMRLLGEARDAGIRLAIATTTTPANVTALLGSSGVPDMESWFEVIGAGDVVPKKKPAPDIYEYVLKKMNLAPDACVAFEDSENGIKSSRGAGLRTVVTINGYTHGHNFDGALIVLDSLGEPGTPFKVLTDTPVNGYQFFSLSLLKSLIG
jgi:beta-phosphoglucomutase-like phosphatase (HAD superfamily)